MSKILMLPILFFVIPLIYLDVHVAGSFITSVKTTGYIGKSSTFSDLEWKSHQKGRTCDILRASSKKDILLDAYIEESDEWNPRKTSNTGMSVIPNSNIQTRRNTLSTIQQGLLSWLLSSAMIVNTSQLSNAQEPIEKKIIVMTGANSGIGFEACKLLYHQ